MLIAQFLFGLVLILFGLSALALGVGLACWLVLCAVRWLPLIGRRHRHGEWDRLHYSRRSRS